MERTKIYKALKGVRGRPPVDRVGALVGLPDRSGDDEDLVTVDDVEVTRVSIKTDKDDYAPGELATITGSSTTNFGRQASSASATAI